jgi:hypothetical protein
MSPPPTSIREFLRNKVLMPGPGVCVGFPIDTIQSGDLAFPVFAKAGNRCLAARFLMRSTALRASLRRKEMLLSSALRHDSLTQTREKRAFLGPVRSPRFPFGKLRVISC